MIKINLLPHREEKRKRQKNDFYSLLMVAGVVGVVIVILVGTIFSRQLSAQKDRNNFIVAENLKLDEKIKEVASLKQEIDGLKARQQAVEDLQGDRNQPVFMLDELVKLTPEGVYLRALKQEGQRILLTGYAQSNQRVAEFLFNLSNKTDWMIKPELIEIKATGIGQGRDAKKVFDFSMNVGIRRPREVVSAASAVSATSASSVVPSAPVTKP
jgi:type IV pilus assembly protein PilN